MHANDTGWEKKLKNAETVPTSELPLNNRIVNQLLRVDRKNLRQVLELTEAMFIDIPGFGQKALQDVNKLREAIGFKPMEGYVESYSKSVEDIKKIINT